MSNYLDVSSKTPIVSHLESLLTNKTIRPCKHLVLATHLDSYYWPECKKGIAEKLPAHNVDCDKFDFHWLKCPSDCALFKKMWRFKKHLLKPDRNKMRFPIYIDLGLHGPELKTAFELFFLGFLSGVLLTAFLAQWISIEDLLKILTK